MKRFVVPLSALVWQVLGTPLAAFAQYPPTRAPGGQGSSGQDPSGGTLPFTGARISLWLAFIFALALAGIVLLGIERRRRAGAPGRPASAPSATSAEGSGA